MKVSRKKKKAILLSLAMTTMLLLPFGVSAQNGLFQRGINGEASSTNEKTSLLGRQNMGATGIIDNQTFGQEVPLGSGLILLLTAGASYVVLKRKEDEK